MSRTWLAKVSKLCNLRCGYCYEWDSLDDRARMSFDVWRRLFAAMHAEGGGTLVLHGGEPLIVPLPYLEEVMALRGDGIDVLVQTNAYRLPDPVLDFLERHRIAVGVSFDVEPGVRLTAGGAPTEPEVTRNLDRLRARGIAVDAITVLAAHTARRIEAVYDFFTARGIPLRVLPLFDGPEARPHARFAISPEAMVDALERLFRRWLETGAAIPLRPFDGWLATVLRRLLGEPAPALDRDLIVDTDGRVFHLHEAYRDGHALGDLATDDLAAILDGARRAEPRDRAILAACDGCAYQGACNGAPAFAGSHRQAIGDRCGLGLAMLERLQRFLVDEAGYDRGTLAAWDSGSSSTRRSASAAG